MHVYLKNGSHRRWLIVQLHGGHVPRISGFPVSEGNEITSSLEPAIWFKLMVVDSVSIDCEKHVVCWTTSSSDPKEDSNERIHLMLSDEDQYCYDFDDDLDELFNLAMFLITTNPMSELNEERRNGMIQEYQRCLFRLLHCYILGKVKLHPEDMNQVLDAREIQLKAISQVDEEVMMHKRISEQYTNQIRELRQTEILPHLGQILMDKGCGTVALSILRDDIIGDVEKIKVDVDNFQARVDQIKKEIMLGASNKISAENLAIARSKRDAVTERMVLLLEWRESFSLLYADIKNKLPDNSSSPLLRRYLELCKEMKREKEIAFELCHKKVRAVSVRECIESTIDDLQRGLTSFGEEVTASGQKATDVISEMGCNTEWQTLTERLSSIVHNPEHPVGIAFSLFTGKIRQRCNEIFRAYERFSDKSAMAEVDGYLVVGQSRFSFNEDLRSIRDDIHHHFDELTDVLLQSFRKNSQIFWRKLRLGYERCFFQQLGDPLQRFYRLANSSAMIDLEKRVRCLREFPVCRLGLQMKDEWWLSLFDPVDSNFVSAGRDMEKSCSETADRVSCCSVDDIVLKTDNDEGIKCYKNIDLMREKLQLGTAKVLSRSWSAYNVAADHFSVDPVRDGALAMAQDISSKVGVSSNFVTYDRIFKNTLQPNKYDSLAIEPYQSQTSLSVSPFPGLRNRSCSTPNMLEPDRRSSLELESKLARLTVKRKDSFEKHFGDVVAGIREVFSMSSPLNKMQCLTASLRIIADRVMKLRKANYSGPDDPDLISHAVNAEDLLPLIVLMLLKLTPSEVGKLYVEMFYISDMMADFLSSGCHSYALTEFQIAFRVLSQICEELSIF